ncbi:Fungal Zn(2)-Cys(6) binuclear cluster domain-containing protein 16 [Elsinoe fawcettii]|nr:Fungal Zn(2)-Cys(6) binuclear cluster domain-containing protein 16 [Elsinoe fawcettii]
MDAAAYDNNSPHEPPHWADRPRTESPKKTIRSYTIVACNACRSRKHKCSGDRPVCTACQDRGFKCVYDADTGTTRAVTLKRKQVELEDEASTLRRLVENLRKRPLNDATNILRHLRSGDDAATALRRTERASLIHQTRLADLDIEGSAFAGRNDPLVGVSGQKMRLLDPPLPSVLFPSPPRRQDQRMKLTHILGEDRSGTEVQQTRRPLSDPYARADTPLVKLWPLSDS